MNFPYYVQNQSMHLSIGLYSLIFIQFLRNNRIFLYKIQFFLKIASLIFSQSYLRDMLIIHLAQLSIAPIQILPVRISLIQQQSTLMKNQLFSSIIYSKIKSTINKYTRYSYSYSSIYPSESLVFKCFSYAIFQPFKLSLFSRFSDIHSQSCSSKIQRMDNKCCCSSCQTPIKYSNKQIPHFIGMCFFIQYKMAVEIIFKSKAQSLSRKISNHINAISSPKRQSSIFLYTTPEAFNNTFVSDFNLRVLRLSLHEQFNSLNRCDYRFRNNSSDTSQKEIPQKPLLFLFTLFLFNLILHQIYLNLMGQGNSALNCGLNYTDPQDSKQSTNFKVNSSRVLKELSEKANTFDQSSQNKIDHQNVMTVRDHENLLSNIQTERTKSLTQQNKKIVCLTKLLQAKTMKHANSDNYRLQDYASIPEIINLLQSLVYALAYFQRKNIYHHDFYPSNIYQVSGQKQNDIFKISHPGLGPSAYSITQQRKRFSFLSPQLIIAVLDDIRQQSISKEIHIKSDVFAIGMIILQFGSLLPSFQCYDEENYNIIDAKIQERIGIIKEVYNKKSSLMGLPILIGNLLNICLRKMLHYEVQERIGIKQLSQNLNEFANQYRFHQDNVDKMRMSSQVTQSRIPNNSIIRVQGPPMSQPPIPQHLINRNPAPFVPIMQKQPAIYTNSVYIDPSSKMPPFNFSEIKKYPQEQFQPINIKSISNQPPKDNYMPYSFNPSYQSSNFNNALESGKYGNTYPTFLQKTQKHVDSESQSFNLKASKPFELNPTQETLDQRVQRILRMSKTLN